MASVIAKKAAGTFVEDSCWSLPVVRSWVTQECRQGSLSESVKRFCVEQPEIIEPSMVIVEGIDDDCIQCRIPCRCYDHEDASTFGFDVRFNLNPQTGFCCRT